MYRNDVTPGVTAVEHGNYVISSSKADRYLSVAVAVLDLKIAKEMIEQCLGDDDADETRDHHEAYWTTALIRFRRAFSKGRRATWEHDAIIGSLSLESQESYAQFRMLADKFVAHSVGIGEDMAVTAVLGPGADNTVVVYGAAVRKTRVSSPGTNLARRLLTLLAELIPVIGVVEDAAHRELLQELRGWPAADLVKGGIYEKGVHFDDTSDLYRNALKAYRRRPSGP